MSTETAAPGPAAGLAGADGGAARPVLELAGVHRTYPGHPPVPALAGIDLSIRQGELVAIVGPSGSGKSTLLHIMGILDRSDSGSVRITGLDIAQLTDRELAALRAARIGFVFQQFFLAEYATVTDNVADGLLYTGTPAGERRRQAMRALHAVGLGHRAQPARPSCPAASASGSRSPARWPAARRSCSPTSRPGISTAPTATPSSP